ncbi:MAG TPA: LamG domain-containing protein, partial [Candidatus Omnitrophota bacterium]|nr:LamG domain-containing protein [Candidatus Omnitrophota bacterium]
HGGAIYHFNGWLDEVRITKGMARWTGNFTPLTTEYVRDANATLLLHFVPEEYQSGAFTVNNGALDTTNAALMGSSGYFNGTNSFLSFADSADWAFGSGDFTIDFRAMFKTLPGANQGATFMSKWVPSAKKSFLFRLFNDGTSYRLELYHSEDGTRLSPTAVAVVNPTVNTWYHIAVVRSGSSMKFFLNGSQIGTTQNIGNVSFFNSSEPLILGASHGGAIYHFNGWLDEVRITQGTPWVSDFTPPVTEYTRDAATKLLLHFTEQEFKDGKDSSGSRSEVRAFDQRSASREPRLRLERIKADPFFAEIIQPIIAVAFVAEGTFRSELRQQLARLMKPRLETLDAGIVGMPRVFEALVTLEVNAILRRVFPARFQTTSKVPATFADQWPGFSAIVGHATATASVERVVIDQRQGVPDEASVLPLVTFARYNPKVTVVLALIGEVKDVSALTKKLTVLSAKGILPENFKIQAFKTVNEFVRAFPKIYNSAAPFGKSVALVTDRKDSFITRKIGSQRNLLSVVGAQNPLKQTASTLLAADKLLDESIWSKGYHFVPIETLGGLEALMAELTSYLEGQKAMSASA